MNEVTYVNPTPEEKDRTWHRISMGVLGMFALIAALFIGPATVSDAPKASASYNWVLNQTGDWVTMQWTSGYWFSLQSGTDQNDVRQVKIPTGKCYRFIGPGVSSGYRAYLAPLYKTLGPGSWFVQKC